METVIAVIAGLMALCGVLLQLALIYEGLAALGRFIIPFLSTTNEELGWFGLWGAWHLAVFATLFSFAKKLTGEMETFQTVAFQLEGIRILATYLVLPLVVSFILSRITIWVRDRR